MNSDAFKDRLKVAMAGESNRSFAEKCAISEGTLRRYLSGETFPPLDTLEVIANAAGVRLSWLASGEGPMRLEEKDLSITPDMLEGMIVSEGHGFIRAYGKIKDKDLVEIVDILEHDLPEAKKFILKVLRGRKETKEGLEGLGLKLKEENGG
jgi:transcriptional regulator with XRE-family HTH domain